MFAGLAFTPAPSHAQLTFHGYPCTDDCSGHMAGYAWAFENGITDYNDCGSNSNSFTEGCDAWVRENYYEDDIGEPYGEEEDDDPWGRNDYIEPR